MRNHAQVLLNSSCSLGKLVNTETKENTLLCIGKNNICISCVLMVLSIIPSKYCTIKWSTVSPPAKRYLIFSLVS